MSNNSTTVKSIVHCKSRDYFVRYLKILVMLRICCKTFSPRPCNDSRESNTINEQELFSTSLDKELFSLLLVRTAAQLYIEYYRCTLSAFI